MDNHQSGIDELLRRRHPSDPYVIEEMVRAYRIQVYRLALSILDHPDEADDATQDALIRAATHLDSYQVGTNLRAWIFTIAVNTCRGYLRKRAARANLNKILISLGSLVSRPIDPEAKAVRNETRTQLWDLVEKLPEKQRLAVILYLAHGLSVTEVAKILRIKPKTVYSRLYEAYRRLRRQLQLSGDYWLLEDEEKL
ncbi:MAG: RNA polymerase sigma factor [Anaerolineales bacterium]|nr:RNA polymerase sigma factor [Anaerolineales bacterium]